MNPDRAESLPAYLNVIKRVRNAWTRDDEVATKGDAKPIWFRGHKDSQWPLSPKIYRKEFRHAQEAEIRQEFQSRAMQLIQGRLPSNKWEWYFLMQHYGAPTRLLDWTDNPLVALFFALHDHQGGYDAAVWALDPWWLNRKLRKEIDGPMEADWSEAQSYLPDVEIAFEGTGPTSQLPAAIEPPHVDRRLAVQRSRFLIFGKTKDLLKSRAAKDKRRKLRKIVIPEICVHPIRDELESAGYTVSAVFPDLEGLCKELCDRWRSLRG